MVELSNRINSFLGMYASQMKKGHEKYMESWESVNHYRKKMKSLNKNPQ